MRVNETTARLEIDTTADLSTATGVFLDMKKPDKSTAVWTCTRIGDYAKGIVEYRPIVGSLNLAGQYEAAIRVTYASGTTGYHKPFYFIVEP